MIVPSRTVPLRGACREHARKLTRHEEMDKPSLSFAGLHLGFLVLRAAVGKNPRLGSTVFRDGYRDLNALGTQILGANGAGISHPVTMRFGTSNGLGDQRIPFVTPNHGLPISSFSSSEFLIQSVT